MKTKIILAFLSLFFATLIFTTVYSLAMIMELSEVGVVVMLAGGLVMAVLFAMMIFEPQPKVVRIDRLCEKRAIYHYDNGQSIAINKDLDTF